MMSPNGRAIYHAMPVCQAVWIQALDAGLPRRQAGLQACDVVCAAAHVQPDLLLYPVSLSLAAPPWQGIETCGRHRSCKAMKRPTKACLKCGCLHVRRQELHLLGHSLADARAQRHSAQRCFWPAAQEGDSLRALVAQGTGSLHLLRLQHQLKLQSWWQGCADHFDCCRDK